jgi:hypothetical protein
VVKQALAIAAALGVFLIAGSVSSNAGNATAAKTQRVTALLTPKQVVTPTNQRWRVPARVAKAKGFLSATLDTKRRTLTWRITFSRLGRPSLVVADVHIGKAGRFGPILVRLCEKCKSGQRGVKKLKADDASKFLAGNTWLTLITAEYPNGVVRGQIKTR